MIIEQTGNTYQPIDYKDEAELQALIIREPKLLSVAENSPKLYSVGSEINTDAGPIDALLIDDTGKLVVVETKLSRNSESRRRVVAQIIDYVSALSRYTYYDFDDATDGKLGAIIQKFNNPNMIQKLVDNNLRSGKVRLVIAVDETNDDLLRIVQFIADHADFEIDVVEVKKYLLNNETIYSSNISLKGRESNSDQKRVEHSHELIDQVVEKWDQEYGSIHPKASSGRGHWRQIRFKGWLSSVHYEFLKSSRENYLEIRLDNEISMKYDPTLRARINEVLSGFNGKKIAGYELEYIPDRRLVAKIDEQDALDKACEVMDELIKLTFEKVNENFKR